MADSNFSSYSTGENRVTAAVLAVLGSLSLETEHVFLTTSPGGWSRLANTPTFRDAR